MTRRLLIAICLGVATALAVAAAAIWRQPWPRAGRGAILHLDRADAVWTGPVTVGPGWRRMMVWPAPGVTEYGRTLAEPLPRWASSLPVSPDGDLVVERIGGGWPLCAVVVARRGRDDSEAHFARTGTITTGLGPAAVVWDDWSLRGVAAIGLIVDSAWWSAPWLALLSAPAVRRAWRRRHGRCPRCSYDRRGSDATADCPECGATFVDGPR